MLLCGCVSAAKMPADKARSELMQLPGGDAPVHRLCQSHSEVAARQLPIQVRDSLSHAVASAAASDCVEVLAVLISVAVDADDTTREGLATVEDAIAGGNQQLLTDTCDEHYQAWQLLRTYRDGSAPPQEGTELEAKQYDGWMERCFRVLLPISRSHRG